MKRPSFQFYPGDWMTDVALRSCSIQARGLWIDMICLMHQGNPYGYLKVNHKVIHESNLSRMVGLTVDEVIGCIQELTDAGVCQTDDDGCYFSKRMIRDENLRAVRAEGGKKGGNPALKEKQNPEARLTLEDKQNPTPSSSSSSSSSISNSSNEELEAITESPLPESKKSASETLAISPEQMIEIPLDLARKFLEYRKKALKVSKVFTKDAWTRLLREANSAGVNPSFAVQYAIESEWQSFTAAYYLKSQGGSHARHQDVDNSAPAKVRRAIEQARRERGEYGGGHQSEGVFEGEFERVPL